MVLKSFMPSQKKGNLMIPVFWGRDSVDDSCIQFLQLSICRADEGKNGAPSNGDRIIKRTMFKTFMTFYYHLNQTSILGSYVNFPGCNALLDSSWWFQPHLKDII